MVVFPISVAVVVVFPALSHPSDESTTQVSDLRQILRRGFKPRLERGAHGGVLLLLPDVQCMFVTVRIGVEAAEVAAHEGFYAVLKRKGGGVIVVNHHHHVEDPLKSEVVR